MISWITENVAIGDYEDSSNVEMLKVEKIDCIFDLRRDDSESIADELLEETLELCAKGGHLPDYYHVAVGRYQGLEPIKIELRTAAYMLEQLTKKYNKILVHCTAGIDRAPFVVAYYLATMETEYQDDYVMSRPDLKFWITRAYKFIKEKRPQIIEHMEWI